MKKAFSDMGIVSLSTTKKKRRRKKVETIKKPVGAGGQILRAIYTTAWAGSAPSWA